MPTISSLAEEARYAVDDLVGAIARGGVPTLRLGVTGLSRSGKTVFITALVHNLIHGGRLPLFKAYAEGRLAAARLTPQPDDEVPRFDYEAHVRALVEDRVWPKSTERISEIRIVIDYQSGVAWKRRIGRGRLNLDLVDYPGEWLLDLALLRKSYAEWSAEAFALSREPHRLSLAAEWHAALADADAAEDEAKARALAGAFTLYLRKARADEHALSMLPPGRFLMPGDMAGSPALTFAPLDVAPDHAGRPGSLAAMMELLYEAYRAHVVKPFFRNHFARLDRQIVLVDVLAAVNAGPAAVRDLEAALADVLTAFRPGRAKRLPFTGRRIDRLLFAATKADHVHHTDHDNLARLLQRLTRRAAGRAEVAGATVKVAALAAVRATRESRVKEGGQPALVGAPMPGEQAAGTAFDGDSEWGFFPGELPDDADALFDAARGTGETGSPGESPMVRYLRFRPPKLDRTAEGMTLSLPHIRLDEALQYLIGDKLK